MIFFVRPTSSLFSSKSFKVLFLRVDSIFFFSIKFKIEIVFWFRSSLQYAVFSVEFWILSFYYNKPFNFNSSSAFDYAESRRELVVLIIF